MSLLFYACVKMLHHLISKLEYNTVVRFLSSGKSINISSLKDRKGARTKKVRVGRGEGSGKGNSSTRGCGGSGQYGTLPRIGNEGGQFPFYLKPPMMGAPSIFAPKYSPLNLNQIEYLIKSRDLSTEKITIADLIKVGAISSINDGVILLGSGKEDFTTKLNIEITKASKSAVEAIRRCGGNATSVYMSPIILRKYFKYFKKHRTNTADDFIKTLQPNIQVTIKNIMEKYNLSTPTEFPPEHLAKIYARHDIGGFMAYANTVVDDWILDPKSIPILK